MHWQNATGGLLAPLIGAPRLGIVTDVDGTISPIVAEPDAAQVTPGNRALLAALAEKLALVAVISGRAVDDVRARVSVPGLVYVGNHGLEWWAGDQVEVPPDLQAYRPALESARRALESTLPPGMTLDDKGATLSLHYRQADDPDAAAAAFRPVIGRIASASGLRLFEGRRVFELRPPLEIDKGSAFARLVTRYDLDAAAYLGDDTTDADALQAARRLRQDGTCYALGLGVLGAETPVTVRDQADLSLSGVDDVEAFFSWLLSARSASST